jgi:hypothetical protein
MEGARILGIDIEKPSLVPLAFTGLPTAERLDGYSIQSRFGSAIWKCDCSGIKNV